MMYPDALWLEYQDASMEVLSVFQNGPVDGLETLGRFLVNVKPQVAREDSAGLTPATLYAKAGDPAGLFDPGRLRLVIRKVYPTPAGEYLGNSLNWLVPNVVEFQYWTPVEFDSVSCAVDGNVIP
ncbi:MAG: hypothetical protein WBG19_01600 [Thermoplasmata archaeon]